MAISTVQECAEESPLSAEIGRIMELMLDELDRQDRDPIVEFKANLVVDEAILLAVEAFSRGSAPESDAHDQLCDLKAQTLVTATLLDHVEEWVAEQLEKLELRAPIEMGGGGGGDSAPLIEDRPIKSADSKSAPEKTTHEVTEMGEQVVSQTKTLRYTVEEEEEKKKNPAEQLPELIKKEDKLAAIRKTEAPDVIESGIAAEKEPTKETRVRRKKSATLKAKLAPVKRLPAPQRHPGGDVFCAESGRSMKSNRIHPALLREGSGKRKRKRPVPAANKSLFSRLFSFFT